MRKMVNNLIVSREPYRLSNMTDLNHLGMLIKAKPDVFMPYMDTLFSSESYYSENPLTNDIMKLKVEETNSPYWEWRMKNASAPVALVIENTIPSSMIGSIGKGNSTFTLKLSVDGYKIGDTLTPGTMNKKYQSRVQSVTRTGQGTAIYDLKLVSKTAVLPEKFTKPNAKWGKLYSLYEEGTDDAGSVHFSGNISLKNNLAKFRKTYQITDYALDTVLAIGIPDPKNPKKIHKTWIRYAEMEFWQQWYKELERGFWNTRSNDTVLGSNGRLVMSGAGIYEQLENSHREVTDNLSAKLIEEYFMDIFYGKKRPKDRGVIRGYSGDYGLAKFSDAMDKYMAKYVLNVENFTRKESADYHSNALGIGHQYSRYYMKNGIVLEMKHNPIQDDPEINFEINPITGAPKNSERITFIDFTSEDGSNNVRMVKKKNGDGLVYVDGMISATGNSQGKSAAHDGDHYKMTVKAHRGAHIHDITRCGEIIPR